MRQARAYNQSIYLMVGMPYLLLATVGFLVYRGLRKRPPGDPGRPLSGAPDEQGAGSCSPPSRAGGSSPAP